MDPFSMTALSMAGSAASGLMGALGAGARGRATSSQYLYQAGIAQLNAKIARQNADYARYTGDVEATRIGAKIAQMIGTQKVAQAAGNLDVNFGSASAVRDTQRTVGMLDQSTARANAARRAYAYETDAAKYDAQGLAYNAAAADAEAASEIDMMSSILGSVTSVASKWYQGNTLGIFGGRTASAGGNGALEIYG